MTPHEITKQSGIKRKPSREEVDDAIAALIASTRRKKRKLNPLEVVKKIQIACDGFGSLPKVADTIGLSHEMLRQIFSVRKCSEEVKKLVKIGKLDSYDILHRISKLPASEQIAVANEVVRGALNANDVRAIVTLRKDLPSVNIAKIIKRIKKSRNIKHYIAYFTVQEQKIDIRRLKSCFEKAFGKKGIVSLEVNGTVGTLVLNFEGKKRLQEAANDKGLTKREYIYNLVSKR